MLKTDSVPGSIGYLMENVCPEMSDPSDCETKVGEWWGYLSQIAFNDQMSAYFCYFSDPKCLLFTGDLFLPRQNQNFGIHLKLNSTNFLLCIKPPVDLYLNFEKSSWKNQVPRTGFLASKNQFRN